MDIVHRADMDAAEILRLYSEGHRIVCRYCKVLLTTKPEHLAQGQRPILIACPNNHNHVLILAESAETIREMRNAMKERKGSTSE